MCDWDVFVQNKLIDDFVEQNFADLFYMTHATNLVI